MNTFLPYPSFAMSAECLDNKRLGKQISETLQIYKALTENKGWIHHPATKMWKGYEKALLSYGIYCYAEWIVRFQEGKRKGQEIHESGNEIVEIYKSRDENIIKPPWLYCNYFTYCMKANLIRKNPEYYGKMWENIEPMEGYFWPKEN